MSIRTFDLVGTIHGREYTEWGEYVSAVDYRELRLENESLRKDADRYRHLKLDATDDGSLIERLDCSISVMNWDSAIDAAMSQGEQS